MAETVAVVGRIADRWLWWGGASGPFGRALKAEQDVPGHAGKLQSFERGQIAWTADQEMLTSVYLLGNEACFEWSRPRDDVDYYRLDVERDGVGLGAAAAQVRIEGDPEDELYRWSRLQGFGHYTFVVKSCTSPLLGSDDCSGWTIPVGVDFGPVGISPFPTDPPVEPIFAERWHELRAWTGPLGRPVTASTTDGAGRFAQAFEHGTIQAVPSMGPGMVVAAFDRELPPPGSLLAQPSIQLIWGGAGTTPYNLFRVDVTHNGVPLINFERRVVAPPLEWADPNRGSGQFIFPGPREPGTYVFSVYGGTGPIYDAGLLSGEPIFTLTHDLAPHDQSHVPIEFPALNDTPAAAFASHRDRALSVARGYARTRPLRVTMRGKSATPSTEDDGVCLLAHFAAAAEERDFHPPGEVPSLPLAHVALRQMQIGKTGTSEDDDGKVPGITWHRDGEFDVTLRLILVIAYRYGHLLTDAEHAFIRHRLIPPGLCFGHPASVETVTIDVDTSLVGAALGVLLDVAGYVGDLDVPVVGLTLQRLVDDLEGPLPESENHLLMTETARYLINQLFFDVTHDTRYDNNHNGMTEWLVQWLQRIAQHDFMEFNARPYARYSLHALMNLHEFARDDSVRTIAQNILDYTMVRYALSSSTLRRVEPYRRLKGNRNRVPFTDENGNLNTFFDWLYSSGCDQLTGFATAYFGDRDVSGHIRASVPDQWAFIGVLAGTAAYRPPPQVYTLALAPMPAVQHRFYHGIRPKVTGSDDVPDGGVEIYYRSPSFLLSAGGMFLNSGYGRDDNVFAGYKQIGVAQATTLMPTHADVRFQDLIRFDPAFGDRKAVNVGVHMGFACGANLVIPQLWLDLTGTSGEGPWTFLNLNTNLPGLGPLGFYVAAYWTPLNPVVGGLVGALWPQTLGLLYAVEAVRSDGTTLDFDQFVAATKQANQLPPVLEYNAQYDFHTGDGHTFHAWLSVDGAKYSARVQAMDGVPLLADLSRLPLAEGPYLNAPGGHDGVIHVLAPDCAAPLILDSSDAHAATRTDSYEACPDYWHRRAVAVIAMADQSLAVSIVRSSTDPAGAVRAARSAVGVLQDFHAPHADALAYYSMLGRALFDLMWRLDAAGGPPDEVAALTSRVVVAFLTAAGQPAADTFTIAATLRTVSIFLSNRHDDEEAVMAQQAAAEILTGPPPPGNEQAFLALGADAAATLAIRLIVAGHGDRVAAAVDAAIAAYERAAAGPAPDQGELAAEMRHAAAQLRSMGFGPDGDRLAAVADQISGSPSM